MKEGDKMTNLNTFVGRIMLAIFGEGETHYINGAETLPPPLTPEKENEIFSKARNGPLTVRRAYQP